MQRLDPTVTAGVAGEAPVRRSRRDVTGRRGGLGVGVRRPWPSGSGSGSEEAVAVWEWEWE